MFNHIFALAPELIENFKKPTSLAKHIETEREKIVRQAQEHHLPEQTQRNNFAKYAA